MHSRMFQMLVHALSLQSFVCLMTLVSNLLPGILRLQDSEMFDV